MSLEVWKSMFDWATIVFIALTVFTGAGALITGDKLAKRQEIKSQEFEKDLTDAKTELSKQQERAANAEREVAEAKRSAKEADAKAEGFRLDIAKANQRSAEAQTTAKGFEKEIAEANQHAADANRIAEEERLKRVQIEERMKPRTLKLSPEAISALEAFKGTEYTFSAVFADEESVTLLKQLDGILLSAGWKRVKPPHAYPAINVYGQEQDFAVAAGLRSGVKISIDSENSLAVLQAMPIGKLPAPLGAAVVLAMQLTASLVPPQDNGIAANIEAGKSMTVRIEIGRKP